MFVSTRRARLIPVLDSTSPTSLPAWSSFLYSRFSSHCSSSVTRSSLAHPLKSYRFVARNNVERNLVFVQHLLAYYAYTLTTYICERQLPRHVAGEEESRNAERTVMKSHRLFLPFFPCGRSQALPTLLTAKKWRNYLPRSILLRSTTKMMKRIARCETNENYSIKSNEFVFIGKDI